MPCVRPPGKWQCDPAPHPMMAGKPLAQVRLEEPRVMSRARHHQWQRAGSGSYPPAVHGAEFSAPRTITLYQPIAIINLPFPATSSCQPFCQWQMPTVFLTDISHSQPPASATDLRYLHWLAKPYWKLSTTISHQSHATNHCEANTSHHQPVLAAIDHY